MPEVLTESFCERCGTRYTFEAAAPKAKRLGRLKVLSKGLANFVLSDETSLDEAFADARSDEQREVTNHQLDAFHKTFQFCMSCRQYTCGNCWNEADGRCLSCAPHLGHEILEAPFPNVDPTAGLALADAAAAEHAGNGHGAHPTIDASAWPTMDLAGARQPEGAPSEPVAEATVEARIEIVEPEAVQPEAVSAIAPTPSEAEPTPAPDALPGVEERIDEDVARAVADAQRARAAGSAAAAAAPSAETHHDLAAALAARTTDLFARFRPGHRTGTPATPDQVPTTGDVVAQLEPVGVEHEAPVEPSAPEPMAAEPPVAATEPAAEPPLAEMGVVETAAAATEPAAEPTPAPAPLAEAQVAAPAPVAPAPVAPAAPAREDRIEAPVWRIVAPEAPSPPAEAVPAAATGMPAERPAATLPSWPAPADTPPPQWPMPAADPQWPTRSAATSPVQPDLWAASSQDVLNRPGSGVQACVSCGLPLSAAARFCRRCGSQQH